MSALSPGTALLALLLSRSPRAAELPTELPDLPENPDVPETGRKRRAELEIQPSPPLSYVGFLDQPGDCPPLDARRGDCLERVDFLSLAEDWSGKGARDRARHHVLAGLSKATFRLWEGLAIRWLRETETDLAAIQEEGWVALPPAADTWEAARPDPRWKVALPERSRWLGPAAWTGPGAFFPLVRDASPEGAPSAPPQAVLTGRFALRLGYDGRPHPYDLMSGDRESSAPFFEQMFPYDAAWAEGDPDTLPLGDFAWTGDGAATRLPDDTPATFRGRAAAQFERFSRLIGVAVAQYAMEDFTPNQMRVLAALTLMRNPPGDLKRRTGRTRDLVAASVGQTDAESDVIARMDKAVYSFEGGFALRFEQLPDGVVSAWLARLLAEHPPGPAFLEESWNPALHSMMGDLTRRDATPMLAMDSAAIAAWLKGSLLPGKDVESFQPDVERLGLSLLLDGLAPAERDRAESWIFLDHVSEAISSSLSEQEASAPADLAALAAEQWQQAVSRHGLVTRPTGQGLGAVDPTAICTTRDGLDALSEPVVRVVNLDLLVAGPAGIQDAEALLWATRDALPFEAVDDPEATAPTLEWVADLPASQSLYRLRWHLWSGWHLLWGSEALDDGGRRLGVRTGAVCEDLVLSAPELVATVARAALLDGDLRPSTPVMPGDLPSRRAELPPSAPRPGGLSLEDRAAWLRALGRAPLLSRAQKGRLVVVLDSHGAEQGSRLADKVPRTPYLRRRDGVKDRVETAAWAWYLPADPKAEAALVAPGLRPDASVGTDVPKPRWHLSHPLDWSLSGTLSAFPFRVTGYTCNTTDSDLDVVAACDDTPTPLYAQGLSADLSALSTVWLRPDQGLSAEGGLLTRLDVGTPGHALAYAFVEDDPTDPLSNGPDYDWTLRWQAGLVGGLRWTPLPFTLLGRPAWPWGAERPDGKSQLGRTALGLRGGALYGPGFNGGEITLTLEGWMARSIRAPRGPQYHLSPYHPALWVGPMLAGELGFRVPFSEEGDRAAVLQQSWSVVLGVRGQIRLKDKVASLPEAP